MGDTNLLSVSREWRWATEESHLAEIRALALEERGPPRLFLGAGRALLATKGRGGILNRWTAHRNPDRSSS